jgi:Recombinase
MKSGNTHGAKRTAKAREVGRKVRTARAVSRAVDLAPAINELQASGVTTLRDIAAALNERGIPTASGKGPWQASQVRRMLARL